MELQKLIQDIHAMNQELEKFEEKYGMLSRDFYELYISGALRDEEIEEVNDYGRWAAYYRIKLQREEAYDRLIKKRLGKLRASVPSGALALTPH
ncbi:MAG: hypothetical protein U9Q78_08350 [Chloroflexota bacterium]|nr:hypothetical protein [Chloroflexota bacterium]